MANPDNTMNCQLNDGNFKTSLARGEVNSQINNNLCLRQEDARDETDNLHASNVPSFFFPRIDQLTDPCSQITDITNHLPRGESSSQSFFAKFDSEQMENNFHSNISQVDSLQQKSLENEIFTPPSYENPQQYCTSSVAVSNKPLEPTDVYGRVTCCDGKIVLQLRLINLNTNFPINVSECWLCRNKVHGSSPLYVHKHTFSGMFQVNDEYVNLIIPENNTDMFNNKSNSQNMTTETPDSNNFSENFNDFSTNDVLSQNILSNSNTGLFPYTSHHPFPPFDKEVSGWPHNKSDLSSTYNTSCGYDILTAVDNIYNKTSSSSQTKAATSLPPKVNDGTVLHCLETLKTTALKEAGKSSKVEKGARKRKSKAQKKLSVIRMRLIKSALLETPATTSEVSEENVEGKLMEEHFKVPAERQTVGSLPSLSPNCADSTLLKKSQKQLDSNYNLVKHIIEKTESLVCAFCNNNFQRNFSDYKKHLIEEHQQSPKHIFECPVCAVKFGRNKHLVQHVKIHLGQKAFKCDQCGTTYGREESLKRHLMNHTGRRPYSCTICPKTFARSEFLSAHMQAHNRSKHICERCGVVCSSKFNLSVHQKIHSKNKQFMCELCNKSFVRSDFLDTHMEVVHKKNKPKCDICGKVFSRQDVLKRHQKMHSNITYDCKFCMKSFSRKDRLLVHKRTHSINNELKCSKCPAAFKRRDVLLKHEKLHLQKEQCLLCYKFVSTREKLEVHLNWHKKESSSPENSNKSHICEICGKSVRRKDLLTKHMKRAHSQEVSTDENNKSQMAKRIKSFICDICSKGFTRSCNLRTHVLKVHTVSSAARKQCNTEGTGQYNEEYDEDDPDGIDQLNTALTITRHSQSNNLVDLSTWTSKRQSSIESFLRQHSNNIASSSHLLTADTREGWGDSPPPPPSIASTFSTLPSLSTPPPPSPNLSAEAISAAAYLLAYPSYMGPSGQY